MLTAPLGERIVKLSIFTELLPTQVTQEIEEFCAEVVPGQKPVYVPVRPEAGAGINRCHVTVERHVQALGGEPVYGWIIWQSAALLHAEFHCNWMTPTGELIDITPKVDGETAILFLSDPARRWAGRLVPSRRKARRNSPPLARLVAVLEERDRIMAKCQSGQPVAPLVQQRLTGLELEYSRLMQQVKKFWKTGQHKLTAAARTAKKKADRKRRKRRRGK